MAQLTSLQSYLAEHGVLQQLAWIEGRWNKAKTPFRTSNLEAAYRDLMVSRHLIGSPLLLTPDPIDGSFTNPLVSHIRRYGSGQMVTEIQTLIQRPPGPKAPPPSGFVGSYKPPLDP